MEQGQIKRLGAAMHAGWRHNVDPCGEAVTDAQTGRVGSLKRMSGLRPMAVERLAILAREGAQLTPEEQARVDEYRKMLAWD